MILSSKAFPIIMYFPFLLQSIVHPHSRIRYTFPGNIHQMENNCRQFQLKCKLYSIENIFHICEFISPFSHSVFWLHISFEFSKEGITECVIIDICVHICVTSWKCFAMRKSKVCIIYTQPTQFIYLHARR